MEIITFGKYKGKTFDWIAKADPSYIFWLATNVVTCNIPETAREIAVKSIKEQRKGNNGDIYNSYDMERDADFRSAFEWGSQ